MTWVKLDDQFFRNPKVRAAGKDGRELYIAGLCHCAAQLTDGQIDKAIILVLAAEAEVKPSAAKRLVTLELWSDDGDAYVVHDYLAWNPSAKAVRARRAQRAAAGQRGGKRSGESRRSKPQAGDEANASANAKQNGSGNSSENEADANPGPGPGPGPLTDVLEGQPQFKWGANWRPSEASSEWAYGVGYTEFQLRRQTGRFVATNLTKRTGFRDIELAWRAWMRQETPERAGCDMPALESASRCGLCDAPLQPGLNGELECSAGCEAIVINLEAGAV